MPFRAATTRVGARFIAQEVCRITCGMAQSNPYARTASQHLSNEFEGRRGPAPRIPRGAVNHTQDIGHTEARYFQLTA